MRWKDHIHTFEIVGGHIRDEEFNCKLCDCRKYEMRHESNKEKWRSPKSANKGKTAKKQP
jgi:hypothetical protein